MQLLAGRKAIIAGGMTGIGRGIAVLLASESVKVFVFGRDPQHLDDALDRIREVDDGDGVAIDLADVAGVDTFMAAARSCLGDFDIAVVNAAIPAKGITDLTQDKLRYATAADFTAYLTSAHAASELMQDHGDIVFIGSMAAHVLGPGSSVYAGMKAGVAGFSEALRKELGPKGSRSPTSSQARPVLISNTKALAPKSRPHRSTRIECCAPKTSM